MKERRRRSSRPRANAAPLRLLPLLLVLLLVLLLAASPGPFPLGPPLSLRAAEDATDAAGEKAAGAAPAPARAPRGAAAPGALLDLVPAEYRGNAMPLESAETAAVLRRAEESFAAGEWTRGLAAIDEALGSLASGIRRKQAPPPRAKDGAGEKEEGAEPPAEGRVIVPFGGGAAPSAELEGEEDPELSADEEVHSSDGILYRPLAASVRSGLLALPPEARAAASRTYEAPARAALQSALALPPDAALRELARVAERYPLAPSGGAAWAALGERLLAAGRFGEAARAFEAAAELVPATDSVSRVTLITRSAVSRLLAGAPEEARRLLSDVARRSPDAIVPIRGEPVAAREILRHPYFEESFRRADEARARRMAPPSSDAFSWATEAGSFDRRAFPFERSAMGELGSQAAWIFPLVEGLDAGRRSPAQTLPQNRPQLPHLRGATLGERVFVRRGSEIVCLSARSGKILWVAAPSDAASTAAIPGNVGTAGSLGLDAVLGLAVVAPAPGAGLASGAAPDATADRATGSAEARHLVLGIDRMPGIFQTRSGKLLFEPNALVACDVSSGKLRWRARAKAPGFPKGIALASAPVVCGERIVVQAVQGESQYAVAFNPSGKLLWTRRLYTAGHAALLQYGRIPSFSGSLAAGETTVVSAGGLGLVSAVAAESGEVLWVSRYRSDLRRGLYLASRPSGAPVIAAGAVVVAPADSDHLTAFDLHDGRILWERRSAPSLGGRLLGADEGRLYVAGDRVRALEARTGETRWESDALDFGVTEGFAMRDAVLVAGGEGNLRLLDAATGRSASRMRIIDSRIDPAEAVKIFLARDTILAATPSRIFALKPQTDAWTAIQSGAREDPFRRVALLEAEARYEEAMGALEELFTSLRSADARERARSELVNLARKASGESKKPAALSRILALGEGIAKDREELLALRLLEASYLEREVKRTEEDAPREPAEADAAARLVRSYLELSRLEGVTVPSPDGHLVDVGAYASDALRELRSAGIPVEDPEGEARARNLLERNVRSPASPAEPREGPVADAVLAARRDALSQVLLRSSHLDIAAEACAELAARGAEDGDLFSAGEMLESLRSDFPEAAYPSAHPPPHPQGAAGGGVRGLSGGVPPAAWARQGLRPTAGLAAAAGGEGAPLETLFWTEGEDELLVETAEASAPLPALFTLGKGTLRAYDPAGGVVLERELPDYPDIGDFKTRLQSGIEEPAAMVRAGDRLVLFTPAGFHAFSEGSAEATRASTGGPADAAAEAWKPRDFRLRWLSRLDHPLVGLAAQNVGVRIWGGGISLPDGRLFFPGLAFDDAGRPLVTLGDGSVFSIDLENGKRRWRVGGEGSAALGGAALRGPWIHLPTAAPAGIRIVRNPDTPAPRGGLGAAGGRDGPPSSRFVPGPETGVWNAGVALGGTVAVFAGQGLAVREAATGRTLWSAEGGAARLSFIFGSELWLSEGAGALVARSARSGRERRRLELPQGGFAVDTFTVLDAAPEPVARLVVVGRDPSASVPSARARGSTQTGTDLRLVRLGPTLEKVWEASIHEGPVTYLGGRYLAEDGSLVLLYNGEMDAEKWYTRLLRVDLARGETRLLASVELPGRGTGQAPRLAVLRGGLALGNAAGFGWLAPPRGDRDAGAGEDAR